MTGPMTVVTSSDTIGSLLGCGTSLVRSRFWSLGSRWRSVGGMSVITCAGGSVWLAMALAGVALASVGGSFTGFGAAVRCLGLVGKSLSEIKVICSSDWDVALVVKNSSIAMSSSSVALSISSSVVVLMIISTSIMGSGCGIGGVGGVGIACGAGGVGIACGAGGIGIACVEVGVGIACVASRRGDCLWWSGVGIACVVGVGIACVEVGLGIACGAGGMGIACDAGGMGIA